MENIEQMEQRHEKEVKQLQASCKHSDISDWMPFMWAPGHFGSDVKVCNTCGKIMESAGGVGWSDVPHVSAV